MTLLGVASERRRHWSLSIFWLLILLSWQTEPGVSQESLSVAHLEVTLVVGGHGTLEVEERVRILPTGAPTSEGRMGLQRPIPLQQPSLFGPGMRRVRWSEVDVTGPGEESLGWRLRGSGGGEATLMTSQVSLGEVTLRYSGDGMVERQGETAGFRWTLVPRTWERDIQTATVLLVLPLGVTGVRASIQGAGQDQGLRGTDDLESRFLFQLNFSNVAVAGNPPILEAHWDGDILSSPSLTSLVRRGLTTYWPLFLPLLSVGFLGGQRVRRRPVAMAGPFPDDLTSAESGFLLNLRIEARDLVASLLELERGGALDFVIEGGSTPLLGLHRTRRILVAPKPGEFPDSHPGTAALRELVGPEMQTTSLGESPEALPRALRALSHEVESHLVKRGLLERPLSQMVGHGMSLAVGLLLVGIALAGLGVEYLLLPPAVSYGAGFLFALPFAFRHHLIPPWTAAGREAQAAVQALQRELAGNPAMEGMEAHRLALVGSFRRGPETTQMKSTGGPSTFSTGVDLLEEVEAVLSPWRGWRGNP